MHAHLLLVVLVPPCPSLLLLELFDPILDLPLVDLLPLLRLVTEHAVLDKAEVVDVHDVDDEDGQSKEGCVLVLLVIDRHVQVKRDGESLNDTDERDHGRYSTCLPFERLYDHNHCYEEDRNHREDRAQDWESDLANAHRLIFVCSVSWDCAFLLAEALLKEPAWQALVAAGSLLRSTRITVWSTVDARQSGQVR